MAVLELETDANQRAGRGSKRASSPAQGGGGPTRAPAARGALGRALARFRQNVWAPIVLRLLGIVGGMLALAAIGASSIARGSGVPFTASSGASTASFLAGGLTPVASSAATPGAPAPNLDGGAPASDAGSAPSDAGSSASAGLTPDGKVILNLASPDELRKLPGVGQKRAQAIVDLRTRLGGRFKRVTDLLRVKGIGPKGLKKMEPHLVLDAAR
jgi:competence protein ComEA